MGCWCSYRTLHIAKPETFVSPIRYKIKKKIFTFNHCWLYNSQSHRGGKAPLTPVIPLQEIGKRSSDFSMGTYAVFWFVLFMHSCRYKCSISVIFTVVYLHARQYCHLNLIVARFPYLALLHIYSCKMLSKTLQVYL